MTSPGTALIRAVAPWAAGPCLVSCLLAWNPTPASAADTSEPGVIVLVARASNACFSAAIRVAGTLVARKEAIVIPEVEGYRIVQILAREGDTVTAGQTLARLTRPAGEGAPAPAAPTQPATALVRAPAAGVVIQSNAVVGGIASARAGPLFRIAVDGDVELAAEVPSIYVPKLEAKQNVRVTTEDNRDLTGRVRTLPAQIDPQTQLGRVRIAVEHDPTLRVGEFARATINASRSCGVSVPKTAVLYRTEGTSVQVVRDNVVETRRVRVGLFSDAAVEISEGVSEGELVVANAGTSLHDGDKVKATLRDDSDRTGGR
jgi:multidrug efflux pump subunit AcrA (membrane-fusion protein)